MHHPAQATGLGGAEEARGAYLPPVNTQASLASLPLVASCTTPNTMQLPTSTLSLALPSLLAPLRLRFPSLHAHLDEVPLAALAALREQGARLEGGGADGLDVDRLAAVRQAGEAQLRGTVEIDVVLGMGMTVGE